jgi:hypothetical protein
MAEKSDGGSVPPGSGQPPDRNACSVCGKTAPATRTDYTLISSEHAWRRTITRAPDGTRIAQWICKDCWEAQHKPS